MTEILPVTGRSCEQGHLHRYGRERTMREFLASDDVSPMPIGAPTGSGRGSAAPQPPAVGRSAAGSGAHLGRAVAATGANAPGRGGER